MDKETAVARKRVQGTKAVMLKEPEDLRNAERAGLTTRTSDKPFEDIFNGIRDSLMDLASWDVEEDGEDETDDEEDTVLPKRTEDDESG